MSDDERWADIPKTSAQVSSLGRVRDRTGAILRTSLSNDTHYLSVNTIADNGRNCLIRIHRAVANAFLPNPYNLPFVIHIDLNKTNNRADNLKWSNKQQTRTLNRNQATTSSSTPRNQATTSSSTPRNQATTSSSTPRNQATTSSSTSRNQASTSSRPPNYYTIDSGERSLRLPTISYDLVNRPVRQYITEQTYVDYPTIVDGSEASGTPIGEIYQVINSGGGTASGNIWMPL